MCALCDDYEAMLSERQRLKAENQALKAQADIVAAMLRKSLVYLQLEVAISKTYERQELNG